MGEIIGAIITGILAFTGIVFTFCKWVIKQSQVTSKENKILHTNHLAHHKEWLEPRVEQSTKDIAWVKGYLKTGIDTDD